MRHASEGRPAIEGPGVLLAGLASPAAEALSRLRRSGDAEAVHALRVTLARLRVALWLFPEAPVEAAEASLDAELKWLRRLCSPLRDWDVLIAACRGIPPPDDAPQAMAALLALAAAERAQAWASIRRRLDGARCRRLLLRLRLLGDRSGAAIIAAEDGAALLQAARARLRPLLAKLRRRARRIDRLDDGQLHRLRIRLRRPRHACELLREHGDAARGKAFHRALARLHTRLGTIQDRAIAERLVAVLRERDGGAAIHAATRAVRAQLRRNVKRRRRQLVEAWSAFEATPAFWAGG